MASQVPSRKPLFRPRRAFYVFAALFIFAVPWWWRWFPELGGQTLFGAPIWFVTAIGGSLAISAVTARYLSLAWSDLDKEDADHG